MFSTSYEAAFSESGVFTRALSLTVFAQNHGKWLAYEFQIKKRRRASRAPSLSAWVESGLYD
jgi:hypothetical protein